MTPDLLPQNTSVANFPMMSELSNTELIFFFFWTLSDSSKSSNIGHDYIKHKLGIVRGKTGVSNCIKKENNIKPRQPGWFRIYKGQPLSLEDHTAHSSILCHFFFCWM